MAAEACCCASRGAASCAAAAPAGGRRRATVIADRIESGMAPHRYERDEHRARPHDLRCCSLLFKLGVFLAPLLFVAVQVGRVLGAARAFRILNFCVFHLCWGPTQGAG